MNSVRTAAISLLIMVSGCFIIALDVTDAFAEEDCQTFYTFRPAFTSQAHRARSVNWDFCDGIVLDSRDADIPDKAADYAVLLAYHGGDVKAPVHKYAEKGTYTVTQTVYSSLENEDDADSMSMKICVMGDPEVTFVDRKTTITVRVLFVEGLPQSLSASQIPQINDEAFEGWYYDDKYTKEWNPTDLIDGHKTLYAKYTDSESFLSSSYFPIILLIVLAGAAFGIWKLAGRRV